MKYALAYHVDDHLEVYSRLLCCSGEEMSRISKIRHGPTVRIALGAQGLMCYLSQVLFGCVPQDDGDVALLRSCLGRPYFKIRDRADIKYFDKFSISHDGSWILAYSNDNSEAVGLDVCALEFPARSPESSKCRLSSGQAVNEFFDHMKDALTDSEWMFVRSTISWIKFDNGAICRKCWSELCWFYTFWALKESFLKAKGLGLTLELKNLEFRITAMDWDHMSTHLRAKTTCDFMGIVQDDCRFLVQRFNHSSIIAISEISREKRYPEVDSPIEFQVLSLKDILISKY